MSSKKIIGTLKVQIDGNGANASKLSQVFGMKGIGGTMKKFCDEFNSMTKGRENQKLRVIITIYEDKTISFVVKNEPVSISLLKALNLDKGSGTPNMVKKGVLPNSKVREIAERKMEELNAYDIDSAIKIIKGTARSIGIDVE